MWGQVVNFINQNAQNLEREVRMGRIDTFDHMVNMASIRSEIRGQRLALETPRIFIENIKLEIQEVEDGEREHDDE